jgi:lysozyme
MAEVAAAPTNTNQGSSHTGQTQRLSLPLAPSNEILAFMGVWENGCLNGINFQNQLVTDGMILKSYLDTRGYLTVGCGHKVLPSDHIHPGQTISMDKARELLRHDRQIAIRAVNTQIHVPLFQYEYDALLDLAWNCGEGDGFAGLAHFVNTHDYSEVPAFIRPYRDGHGNHRRRVSEAKLFETGVYDARH